MILALLHVSSPFILPLTSIFAYSYLRKIVPKTCFHIHTHYFVGLEPMTNSYYGSISILAALGGMNSSRSVAVQILENNTNQMSGASRSKSKDSRSISSIFQSLSHPKARASENSLDNLCWRKHVLLLAFQLREVTETCADLASKALTRETEATFITTHTSPNEIRKMIPNITKLRKSIKARTHHEPI